MLQGYGYIKSPKDLRNYRITNLAEELPKTYKVHHSHIKNQGNVDSCVAHSVSEVLEAYDGINYSTNWIYGYRENCENKDNKGMCVNTAIGTIYKVGYLTYTQLSGNDEMPKAREIVDKNLESFKKMASERKISGYAYLKTIDEVKQAIYNGGLPVIISIDVDSEGLQLDKYNTIKPLKKPYGGHTMVCYGWNKKGLLIQNSWGEEWGDNGCCVLPYDYPFTEAWTISFDKSELNIEKPSLYWLRELIMLIIKLIRYIRK